ncbi:MAG: ABC transporter ATP-binding protein [Planctomycetales bacterium]|nr:ABC transporter ATP-binding protein [Planctomycetales bacterium]
MAKQPPVRKAIGEFLRVANHFRADLARERWRAAQSFIALLVGVIAQLLEPWPLKYIIDSVLSPQVAGGPQTHPHGASPAMALVVAGVAYVLIIAVRASADYVESVGFAMIGSRVVARLRSRLFSHLQALPLAFHNKSRHGDLLARVVGDIRLVRDVAVTAVLPLAASALILVGMAGVMLWVNWRLALVALSVLPLFLLSTVKIGGRIHQAARKQRQHEGRIAASAAEAISAMQVVKALSLESRFDASFAVNENRSASDEVKTRKLVARLSRTTDLLIAVSTAVVLVYGGRLVIAEAMTIGGLVVFLTYMKRGLRPLKDFAKYAARLSKASAAAQRIFELLEAETDAEHDNATAEAPRLKGAIEFSGLDYGYDSQSLVLKDFSASIAPGEFVAIVGDSGVGKSTLLSLLLRFYEPTRGSLAIDGTPINRWTRASLRAQISIVLQDTVLFVGSIADNIAYGADDVTPEAIEAAAKLARADEFIARLPEGYDTVVGERGVTLSHGQRQRIAIARAAVRNAPILLLDEPATALDQHNKALVREGLARLASGRTTLMVTHDLNDALSADRILLIQNGRIAEQGSHQDLISLGGRYAEMHRIQRHRHTTSSPETPRVAVR